MDLVIDTREPFESVIKRGGNIFKPVWPDNKLSLSTTHFLVASDLNGNNGEATNADDLDNAGRVRNNKEARNRLRYAVNPEIGKRKGVRHGPPNLPAVRAPPPNQVVDVHQQPPPGQPLAGALPPPQIVEPVDEAELLFAERELVDAKAFAFALQYNHAQEEYRRHHGGATKLKAVQKILIEDRQWNEEAIVSLASYYYGQAMVDNFDDARNVDPNEFSRQIRNEERRRTLAGNSCYVEPPDMMIHCPDLGAWALVHSSCITTEPSTVEKLSIKAVHLYHKRERLAFGLFPGLRNYCCWDSTRGDVAHGIIEEVTRDSVAFAGHTLGAIVYGVASTVTLSVLQPYIGSVLAVMAMTPAGAQFVSHALSAAYGRRNYAAHQYFTGGARGDLGTWTDEQVIFTPELNTIWNAIIGRNDNMLNVVDPYLASFGFTARYNAVISETYLATLRRKHAGINCHEQMVNICLSTIASEHRDSYDEFYEVANNTALYYYQERLRYSVRQNMATVGARRMIGNA